MDGPRHKTDWRSIYTLCVITFLMSLQTGTVNINLWAYITEVCYIFVCLKQLKDGCQNVKSILG
jgi:hypothetical protein